MLKKSTLLLLIGVMLAVGFGYGVAQLFILRFERGDVYPPYSTMRADPLGAKGVYEALRELPGVELQRNFKPLPKLPEDTSVTLVYAGVARYAMWESREIMAFDRLVLGGSRAIFGFLPFERSPYEAEIKEQQAKAKEWKEKQVREEEERERKKETKKDSVKEEEKPAVEKEKDAESAGKMDKEKASKDKDKTKKKDDEDFESRRATLTKFDEVAKRWGLAFDFLPVSEEKSFDRRALLQDKESGLEEELAWHSALYFKDLKPEWRVLYRCEEQPVVIERAYGKGSIVLVADTYFLSNEAMRSNRSSRLLAWVFSGPEKVVFDEEHHGIRDEPGIASLARKYRLHGVVAGLALLAILFVWKSAVRFLPPLEGGDSSDDVVMGRDSAAGFVNLLRRTIPPSSILETCIGEWRKAFPHQPAEKLNEIQTSETARPARERDPVTAYQAIARAMSRHSKTLR